MTARFLVIGSNSFSGASFVDHLLEREFDVIGVSRSAEPHVAFLPYRWRKSANGFRFQRIDLNHDLEALMRLVVAERPEYVVNFAAQSMVAESWKNPDHWMMTNVVSTVRLHEQLRHLDFLRRYVHISTPEVYGTTEGRVADNAPFNPSTPYAVSRAAADMSLRTFSTAYNFPVIFTRAANVYGPGQQLYRIIPRTILYLRLGRRLPLHGGGHTKRSFIHMRDVCDATLRATLSGRNGHTYHISTQRMTTIRELVQCICARLGKRFEDSVEETGERLGKDAVYDLDSSATKIDLGWVDQIQLEEGLDQTILWVDRFFEELKSQPFEYVHRP